MVLYACIPRGKAWPPFWNLLETAQGGAEGLAFPCRSVGPRGKLAEEVRRAVGRITAPVRGRATICARNRIVFMAGDGTVYPVFLSILHQEFPICHVLCYTFAHEGCGLLSVVLGVVTQL
jgi:hypothetical protein